MGKVINKVRDFTIKYDPLRGGDVLLDRMGLPNMLGDKQGTMTQDIRDKNALDYAEQQQLLEHQMQARLTKMQSDMANADLSNSASTTVLEGAAAEDAQRTKSNSTAKLSTSLGFGG